MHSWRTRTVCKFLARAAKRSVLWLSSVCQFAGVTLHTIADALDRLAGFADRLAAAR